MGVAFTNIQVDGGICPAVTGERFFVYMMNLGQEPFAHTPPAGHRPVWDYISAHQARLTRGLSLRVGSTFYDAPGGRGVRRRRGNRRVHIQSSSSSSSSLAASSSSFPTTSQAVLTETSASLAAGVDLTMAFARPRHWVEDKDDEEVDVEVNRSDDEDEVEDDESDDDFVTDGLLISRRVIPRGVSSPSKETLAKAALSSLKQVCTLYQEIAFSRFTSLCLSLSY